MTVPREFIWCQGCGIEVTWSPYLNNEQMFCCEECSRGIFCRCAERMELDNDRQGNSSVDTPQYS